MKAQLPENFLSMLFTFRIEGFGLVFKSTNSKLERDPRVYVK